MGSPSVIRDFYSQYPMSVPDELIAPLRPYGWRLSGAGRYPGVGVTHVPAYQNVPAYRRLKALGVKEIQILLQSTPYPALKPPFSPTDGSLPSDGTCVPTDAGAYNCTSWEGMVRRALQLTVGMEDLVSFDVWNELDSISWAQFLARWRSAGEHGRL